MDHQSKKHDNGQCTANGAEGGTTADISASNDATKALSFDDKTAPNKTKVLKNNHDQSSNNESEQSGECEGHDDNTSPVHVQKQKEKSLSPSIKISATGMKFPPFKIKKDDLAAKSTLDYGQTTMSKTKPKTEAKKSKKTPIIKKPKPPMNAYNLFIKMERQYLIQTASKSNIPDLQPHEIEQDFELRPLKYRNVVMRKNWWKPDGEVSTRKISKKNRLRHGVVSFTELNRKVAHEWNILDPKDKLYFQRLGDINREEYFDECHEYHEKKQTLRPCDAFELFLRLEKNLIIQSGNKGAVEAMMARGDEVDRHTATRPPKYSSVIMPKRWYYEETPDFFWVEEQSKRIPKLRAKISAAWNALEDDFRCYFVDVAGFLSEQYKAKFVGSRDQANKRKRQKKSFASDEEGVILANSCRSGIEGAPVPPLEPAPAYDNQLTAVLKSRGGAMPDKAVTVGETSASMQTSIAINQSTTIRETNDSTNQLQYFQQLEHEVMNLRNVAMTQAKQLRQQELHFKAMELEREVARLRSVANSQADQLREKDIKLESIKKNKSRFRECNDNTRAIQQSEEVPEPKLDSIDESEVLQEVCSKEPNSMSAQELRSLRDVAGSEHESTRSVKVQILVEDVLSEQQSTTDASKFQHEVIAEKDDFARGAASQDKNHHELVIGQMKETKEPRQVASESSVEAGLAWKDKEDWALLELYKMYGGDWGLISCLLPGRTEQEVQSRWLTISSQNQAMGGVSLHLQDAVQASVETSVNEQPVSKHSIGPHSRVVRAAPPLQLTTQQQDHCINFPQQDSVYTRNSEFDDPESQFADAEDDFGDTCFNGSLFFTAKCNKK